MSSTPPVQIERAPYAHSRGHTLVQAHRHTGTKPAQVATVIRDLDRIAKCMGTLTSRVQNLEGEGALQAQPLAHAAFNPDVYAPGAPTVAAPAMQAAEFAGHHQPWGGVHVLANSVPLYGPGAAGIAPHDPSRAHPPAAAHRASLHQVASAADVGLSARITLLESRMTHVESSTRRDSSMVTAVVRDLERLTKCIATLTTRVQNMEDRPPLSAPAHRGIAMQHQELGMHQFDSLDGSIAELEKSLLGTTTRAFEQVVTVHSPAQERVQTPPPPTELNSFRPPLSSSPKHHGSRFHLLDNDPHALQ